MVGQAVLDEHAGMIAPPKEVGYYVRWELPDWWPDGSSQYFRTKKPSKTLEKAKYAIPKIRRMFGRSNAWNFAVFYWDGERADVVYEDEDSKITEQKTIEEYNAEAYN